MCWLDRAHSRERPSAPPAELSPNVPRCSKASARKRRRCSKRCRCCRCVESREGGTKLHRRDVPRAWFFENRVARTVDKGAIARVVAPRRARSARRSPPAPRARRAAHPPEALVAGAGLLVAPHAPRASRGCSLAVVVSARKPSLPRSRRVARGSACGARPKHENDFCFLTKNRLDDHLARLC